MAREKDDLVDIACAKCTRFLASALAGAQAYCPNCKSWSKAPPRKGK